ncbi:hypothetical protein AUR65_018760 [Haloferax marisrubri]|uniref:Uncharacterized protein n=1 Tax=Haloferax marisrubri TaxID=1544719 RepID=A0A2P4NL02_9EURY|nr:hypothetical protein AUR65_018760 [Haloferax marisrubri]
MIPLLDQGLMDVVDWCVMLRVTLLVGVFLDVEVVQLRRELIDLFVETVRDLFDPINVDRVLSVKHTCVVVDCASHTHRQVSSMMLVGAFFELFFVPISETNPGPDEFRFGILTFVFDSVVSVVIFLHCLFFALSGRWPLRGLSLIRSVAFVCMCLVGGLLQAALIWPQTDRQTLVYESGPRGLEGVQRGPP